MRVLELALAEATSERDIGVGEKVERREGGWFSGCEQVAAGKRKSSAQHGCTLKELATRGITVRHAPTLSRGERGIKFAGATIGYCARSG